MKLEEGACQIDDCEYLFVDSIRQLEMLTLEIVVMEAKLQARVLAPRDGSEAERILVVGSRPIEVDSTCRRFRLTFNHTDLVSYAVLNESYAKYPEPSEAFAGKLFRIFTRSHLLEFTRRTTIASDLHSGALRHYQIACQDYVVDVISTAAPSIARANVTV